MNNFTIHDLTRLMRKCAGENEEISLDGDIADVAFDDLGYDSLALMETASAIERELKISLPDDLVFEAGTPGSLVAIVNERVLAAA
jgi:minimal PKS acyl carrier protein